MNKAYLSQDELQHIEHCNKVLEAHHELVTKVISETQEKLNNYLPIVSTYVNAIADVRRAFGEEVKHILQSNRQLQIVTGSAQDVINFTSAVVKLNQILTPEFIEKLQRISEKGNG